MKNLLLSVVISVFGVLWSSFVGIITKGMKSVLKVMITLPSMTKERLFDFMFHTQYERHERKLSNIGDREKVIYSPKFDKNGVLELEESGRENLYDFIQSHKDSVDINKILQRFANGDVNALNKVQGMFGDFTEMPKTYADALNAVISAETQFNTLPVEVRAKFGHSFSQWLAKTGSPEWLTAMGMTAEGVSAPQDQSDKATPAAGDNKSDKGDEK